MGRRGWTRAQIAGCGYIHDDGSVCGIPCVVFSEDDEDTRWTHMYPLDMQEPHIPEPVL